MKGQEVEMGEDREQEEAYWEELNKELKQDKKKWKKDLLKMAKEAAAEEEEEE